MPAPVKPTYWKLNYRHRRYVDALIESNLHVPTASVKVGLSVQRGYTLKQDPRIQVALEERLSELRSSLKMSPDEILEGITDIARDKTHKDRLRAYELLAKIQGMMADQVHIQMDRGTLISAIMEEVKRIKESGIAQVIEGESKVLPQKTKKNH